MILILMHRFCNLKLIKDYGNQLTREGRMVDGIFLSNLSMLYLYLVYTRSVMW